MSPAARILVAVVLSSCALPPDAEPAHTTDDHDEPIGVSRAAITGGWDDDGDPDVVALMNGGSLTCTGTMIASDLVLTAAHCVAGLPLDEVVAGSDPATPTSRSRVVSVTPHPAFDRATGERDIAVVRISPPIDVPMRPLLFAPMYASDVGASVRFVGFGLSGDGRPLRKRLGVSQVAAITEQTFEIRGESQPCRGDSGGPTLLLLDGVEVLAGVHSSGSADCASHAIETRVDANAVFLGHFIGDTEYALGAPSAALNGQCSATPGRTGRATNVWLLLVALSLAWVRGVARRRRPRLGSSAVCALVAAVAATTGCASWDDGGRSAEGARAITERAPARDAGPGAAQDPDDTTPTPTPTPASPSTPPPPSAPAPSGAPSACAASTIGCLEACADDTCASGCFAADPACADCLYAAFDTCVARHGCGAVLDALDACVVANGCSDDACVASRCGAELGGAQWCLPAGACADDEAACLP